VTTNEAVFAPGVVGANVTVILQFAPAARVAPQVVVLLNSEALVPVKAIDEMFKVAVPMLNNVNPKGELLPMITPPKSFEDGLNETAG
jgi:hypothetical protein